ncbi:hypothetical protein D9M71_300540 [compost metagenome]
MHGRIVVAGGNAFDVEAPVVGLQRTFRAEHHTGGDRRLTAGVADIVAFQALRGFIQGQDLGQGLEA